MFLHISSLTHTHKTHCILIHHFHLLHLYTPLYIYIYIYLLIAFHAISCQKTHTKKQCHLPLIFWWHLLSSTIIVSSNLNLYEFATNKEGRPAFYIEWQQQLRFNVKVGHHEFVGFVNDMIDCGYLKCDFVLKLRRKKKDWFYINFYSIIFFQNFYFILFPITSNE